MKVRKLVIAFAGLLVSASACCAAFGIFQTYLPSAPARAQVNFTDPAYGGVCNSQIATRVTTITNSGSGLRDLAVTVNTFASGDVGKAIWVPQGNSDGSTFQTTIAAFVDAQHITLSTSAQVALSSASIDLTWGFDDTSAFLAFKAAFQGTAPVQLNLPTGICVDTTQFIFRGISDLIVAGQGQANTRFRHPKRTVNDAFQLGGSGQSQNNDHSVRTDDANPGDSCVTLKTAPSVTISNVANTLPSPATFTGSISGTTLTASSVTGTIVVGAQLLNQNSNVSFPTQIVTQLTGPAGGAGTYTVSISQTRASQTFYTAPASFTISGATNLGVMTVTSVEDGTLAVGMDLFNGAGTLSGRTIKSQLTGSAGGPGTYQLDVPPLSAVGADSTMLGNGQMRLTVNSTAGITTGDTVWFNGVTSFGLLAQRVNGLRWVKVVDGTHLDVFQSDFNGQYISGGAGGGDRTSLFPIGATVIMTGWENQAYWASPFGYPSNPAYFEYKRVVSNNPTTHQVCFDTPLVYTYKASWPQMSTGSQFEVDPGGPATLYVFDTSWEATYEFKDFTLDVVGQTYTNARTVTYRDITMLGSNCIAPTQNETHSWINVTGTACNIETDKIVQNWNVTNSSIRKVDIQSSSFVNVNVNGITTVDTWAGSGKRLTMQNATIGTSLKFGIIGYGASEESSCTNCTSADFLQAGDNDQVDNPQIPWSMSGGVITIPNAYNHSPGFEYQLRYLVPGSYVAWFGSGGGGTSAQYGRVFKVTGATQDLDNTYIQTSEAGGFPTGAWTTNGLSITSHPAPRMTVSGMAGNNKSLAVNGHPAGDPMFSYQNVTYTGGPTGTTAANYYKPYLWGEMSSFTFTNNVPYTGGGALTWTVSQSSNWPVLKTDLTQVNYNTSPNGQAIVNTKLPSSCGSCTRTLTPPAAVTNGQVGDTITATPTGAWFGGTANSGPAFSANTPSDSPQVTITLRANQNLPP